MRNCLLPVLVLLLLAANGYALFQILELRQDVSRLRAQVAGLRAAAPTPTEEALSDSVRAALAALQHGDLSTARRELDRFQAKVAGAGALAAERKAKLAESAARAKQALARRRDEAVAALERLLREVPRHKEA